MSMVDKFGEKVGEIAEKDPVKARKIYLQDIDYRKRD